MKIKITREEFNSTCTMGKMFVNGSYFCDTLEDPNRDTNKNGKFDNGEKKVYGNTCIPFGKYKAILAESPRFKRQLIRLIGVPSFEGVLIHRGNTSKDTSGCVLVGEYKHSGLIINSTKYEVELVKRAEEAISKGEDIEIEIK